jgi:hypothetical protein
LTAFRHSARGIAILAITRPLFSAADNLAGNEADRSLSCELQANYKNAVEAWIAAIRKEEVLASGNHEVAEVDREQAHFEEDEMRKTVKTPKEASSRGPDSSGRQRRCIEYAANVSNDRIQTTAAVI